MEILVKQELHKLVEDCDNEVLLLEVKNILLEGVDNDWWDGLSEEDKQLSENSEEGYKDGKFISHKVLMEQFEEWKKK